MTGNMTGKTTGKTTVTGTTRRLRLGSAVLALGLIAGILAAAPAGAQQPKLGSEEFGLTFKQLVKKVEAVEKHVATCMQSAGFDYVANDFDSVRKAMNADKSAPGLSEAEYRRQYGFGITTQFPKPIVALGLGPENARIRGNLSPENQAAYDKTLLGQHTDAVFAYALEIEDFSQTGGCTRKAVQQEFSKRELSSSYINPGDQKISQDPRVKAALKKYGKCMSNAGLDYTSPDEVEPDLQARLDEVTLGADPETLQGVAATKLKELQDIERRVADVSFKCEAKFVEPAVEKAEKELYGRLPK
jgi:hypothetical protein